MRWTLKKSVGPFHFGESIDRFCPDSKLELVEDEEHDATGWLSYKYADGSAQIYTENGEVVSVACLGSFVANDIQIIGIRFNRIQELLGWEPSEMGKPLLANGRWEIPVEYDDLCLQLWISQDHPQTVLAVFASGE